MHTVPEADPDDESDIRKTKTKLKLVDDNNE
jgi:hypothetical protein